MLRRISWVGAWALCAALVVFAGAPRTAQAVPKIKARPAAQSKPTKKNLKKVEPEADADAKAGGTDSADKASDAPDKGEPGAVKSAGTNATAKAATAGAASAVKDVQESKEGVKTYKFGTIEVEGRLKSPQIIYFLRRVRAEFDAGLLGHRSFMRELSDTRNNPALR